MLNQLPHEIVLAISSLLTFKEKVILIRTCRHLYNLISSTDLYSELDLLKHAERMEDMIDLFKDKPYFGEQVRVLSIDLTSLSDQLLVQIRIIFPDITRFKVASDDIDWINYQHHYSKNPIVQWSNTIQEYDILLDWPGILRSLETVIYPQLTNFMLGDRFTLDDPGIGFDFDYFLPVIKNAPSLKWLLPPTAINLEFLEELHSSCRHLESLTLPYSEVFIRDDRLSHPIVPADSLLYLNMYGAHCFDKNGLLLDYISAKYRCLNQLEFSSQQVFKDGDFDFYLDYMNDDGTDEEGKMFINIIT
jgi:hypothetical protein